MQRRYVFRADASPESGAGHVMRVCSIAEEMLERGLEVVLLGEIDGIQWLEERVRSLGNNMKFDNAKEFSPNSKSDVLIIDSYTLDPRADSLSKEKWLKVVAIVEHGTPIYDAQLYIHCGTNKQTESQFTIPNTRFIGGLDYLAIRKSIQKILPKKNSIEPKRGVKILVVGGGTDPIQFVKKLAVEMVKLDQNFEAVLVSNELNCLDSLDYRFSQKNIGSELENELVHSDVIFTLSGTSSWDFLSCGFPLGVVMGYENQRDNFEFQTKNNLALDIGHFVSELDFKFNSENIRKLITDGDLRGKLSEKALSMVDNRGTARIADEIIGLV